MISGDEIRRARQRAGWSQQELADRVGSTYRTVGNWERGKTSAGQREVVLRSALDGFWDGDQQQSVSLRQSSDAELLGEIARRFARSAEITQERQEVGFDAQRTAPNRQAAGSAADDDELSQRRVTRKHTPPWEDDDEEEPVAAFEGQEGIAPDEEPEGGP